MVVILTPSRDQDTGFGQCRKPMVIEAFVPEASVEAFDERILGRFSGLNHLELNPMPVCPLIERLAGELWPLVGPDRLGVLLRPPLEIIFKTLQVWNTRKTWLFG